MKNKRIKIGEFIVVARTDILGDLVLEIANKDGVTANQLTAAQGLTGRIINVTVPAG